MSYKKGSDTFRYILLCILTLGFACYLRLIISMAIQRQKEYNEVKK